MNNLNEYMAERIRYIMGKIYLNVLSNPREAAFIMRMQQRFAQSERRRSSLLADENVEVPPFLIASIATTCNLHCKGCYARQNGIAADPDTPAKQTLTPQQPTAP